MNATDAPRRSGTSRVLPTAGCGSVVAGLVALSAAVVLSGCGAGGPPSSPTPGAPAVAPSPSTTAAQQSPESAPSEEPTSMRVQIRVGDEEMTAILDDSAAAVDLLGQLPQTVRMSDHGGVEKTGRLSSALSLSGQPDGADPQVGDLGYYAPGQDLVLYYGDQSYFPGIVILGRLEADAASRLARMDGDVTVRVERLPG